MSRKTSGALQIQLQTVVKAMEEAVSKLIEKIDVLGGKVDNMPRLASKMADSYVASFGSIVQSVKGLSSQIDKLEGISTGLNQISASLKGFRATEGQAASFDRLAQSLSALGPATRAFPKDVSGLTAFSSSVAALSTSLEGMKGKIPTDAQVDRLNRAANAIRNTGNALKSIGTIPPDALAMFQSMNAGGRDGGGSYSIPSMMSGPSYPDPSISPGPSYPDPSARHWSKGPFPPPPPKPPSSPPSGGGGTPAVELTEPKDAPGFWGSLGKAAALVGSFGVNETLKRQNVDKELSQVMGLEGSTLGALLPGADYRYRNNPLYTERMKRSIANASEKAGVNYEDSASAVALQARYTFGGNRAYGDVRTMEEGPRTNQLAGILANSKLVNQMTGLDLSSASNMQMFMGRDLGIKADEYGKVRDAFIGIQRSGALTAQDLKQLAESARDTGMSLGLTGEKAATFMTDMMAGTAALANAGLKRSDYGDTKAGFFGDKKSLIFDMLAGVTDADYAAGPDVVLKKQYAKMNEMTSGMGNTMMGNFLAGGLIGNIAPASIQGVEQFRKVQGVMGEVTRQRELQDEVVATQHQFTPLTTSMEDLGAATNRLTGYITSAKYALDIFLGTGSEKPPTTPEGHNSTTALGGLATSLLGIPGFGQFMGGSMAYQSFTQDALKGTGAVDLSATNAAKAQFEGMGYRVSSGYRGKDNPLYNPKSLHSVGDAIDIGMGDLKPSEVEPFKKKLIADAAKFGLVPHFEEEGQSNATGTDATGRHAHLEHIKRAFSSSLIPPEYLAAPKHEDFMGGMFSNLGMDKTANKGSEQESSSSLSSKLVTLVESNAMSSGTMSEAVSLFAQAVHLLVSNARSKNTGGQAGNVATGNYVASGG